MRERSVNCQELGCRREVWTDNARCNRHPISVDLACPSLAPVDRGDADPPSASPHSSEECSR